MKYFFKIIKNRILFSKEIQSKSLFLIKKKLCQIWKMVWKSDWNQINCLPGKAELVKLTCLLIREKRSIMRYYAITCRPRGQTRSLGIIIIIGGGLTLIMRAVMQYISTSDHLRGAISLPNMTTFNW